MMTINRACAPVEQVHTVLHLLLRHPQRLGLIGLRLARLHVDVLLVLEQNRLLPTGQLGADGELLHWRM